jgi:hypothetical protein
MSVVLSIEGPYFTGSGPIKFSDIKSTFGGGNNFGSYKRNTSTDATNPIVPDATENANISDDKNLRFGAFRNSIKSYTATQSGTDNNSGIDHYTYPNHPGFRMGNYFDSDNQYGPEGTGIHWNGNLNKNIKKTVNITGTCGSVDTRGPAAQLSPTTPVYNLTINVSGSILGAGGDGSSSGGGGNGGPALEVRSTDGKNITVNISQGAKVYGGGGGGGRGADGGKGADGTCDTSGSVVVSYTYTGYQYVGTRCNSDNPVGYLQQNCPEWSTRGGKTEQNFFGNCGGGNGPDYFMYCGYTATGSKPVWVESSVPVPGAPGGTGGAGGNGQGYNHDRTDGSGGTSGTTGGCPTYGSSGEDGKAGGNGGDWGDKASDASDNTGQAGSAIIGTVGKGYSLTGANSSNCKGSISGTN